MTTARSRKALGVVSVVVAALALGACSSSSGSSSTAGSASGNKGSEIRIDFANFAESSPLFHQIHTNLDTLLAKYPGQASVKWYDNNGDASTMLQNVQLMIQNKPDVIIEYPPTAATTSIGNLIKASKIPCISVNIATPGCYFLNIDNPSLGTDTAAAVGKIARSKGWNASNTTVLLGDNAAAGAQINSVIVNYYKQIATDLGLPSATITPTTTKIAGGAAYQFDGQSQLEPSFTAVKNLLPNLPADKNIILYATGNDAIKGALQALTGAGRPASKILIGGSGGDETGLTQLRSNPSWVAEGAYFFPYWGEYAVAMAQELAKGVKPTASVTALPQVILSKSSVAQYYKPGSTTPSQLPALVASNKYLGNSPILKEINNIK